MRIVYGDDTDTNSAICGALLGAIQSESSIPTQWKEKVLNCRPEIGKPGIHRPRAKEFWPIDALELSTHLISA